MSESPTPAPTTPTGFRAGLVAIIGRTNAGKSTLLNRLVGKKVSIVSPKPQTTRDALHGIVNRADGQIVFVDTPGFFQTHASALVDRLHTRAREAVSDLDVLIHLVDPTREPGPEDGMVSELVKTVKVPRVLCIGKLDARPRPFTGYWRDRAADYQAVVEVSGLDGGGAGELLGAILNLLPYGEPMYPPGETSNANRGYQIAELIREQVYIQMDEEVPYRTKVVVDRVEDLPAEGPEKPASLLVHATIYAPTDKLQRMLIGVGAKRVKQMRQFSRREIRKLTGLPVDLELEIRVDAKAGVPED
jgi:GTP-binding protein Era